MGGIVSTNLHLGWGRAATLKRGVFAPRYLAARERAVFFAVLVAASQPVVQPAKLRINASYLLAKNC